MLAVLRLCNDAFLEEHVFPLLEQKHAGLPLQAEAVAEKVADPDTRDLLMSSVHGHVGWRELVHRLLLAHWQKTDAGWVWGPEKLVFAGEWEESLQRSLMLELPRYSYWDEELVAAEKKDWLENPRSDVGLASLLRGTWEEKPSFAPDEVLETQGLPAQDPDCETFAAGWAYRNARSVKAWSHQLTAKVNRLIWREAERLKPVEIPETSEILDYWLGKIARPPRFTVAFSALGTQAEAWVAQIGHLTRAIREAAADQQGLLVQLVDEPVRGEL
jgi:hypothetical protein